MKNNTVKVLSAIGLAAACQSAFAGAITDIKVTSLSDNQKIIKIKFDRDLVEPKGFLSQNDSALVLDFSNSSARLPQSQLEFNDSLVKEIVAAGDGKRARVALSLNKPSEYYTERKNDEIWVYLSTATKASNAASASYTTKAAAPVAKTPPIIIKETVTINTGPSKNSFNNDVAATDVPMQMSFAKGKNGSGRILLTLPKNAPKPNISQNAASLTIQYPNVAVAAADQKKLDTSELLTPVQSVQMARIGNNTLITITNKDSWDYKEYSENGKYVFEILPKTNLTDAQSPLSRKKNFTGGKVTLDFQNIDVRTILQILAKESGMNIVASDTVTGSMTLNLKDVPWDQALDLVMKARNLDMRKQGNIINIAPKDELFEQDKKTLTYESEIQNLGALVSQTFQLRYKNVEEFKDILKLGDGTGNVDRNSILSSRGSALIDPSTNTLIITDNPTVIRKFKDLIQELDVAAQQVMIEARIVEARDSFMRTLGAKINYAGNSKKWSGGGQFGGRILGDSTDGWIPVNGMGVVRQGASSIVGLTIDAAQEEGTVKIISSPRVLTQDRKEATIEKGTEIPYQEASSSGATSTSFKKAVLGLTVTPQITPDGNIIMDLQINKDSVSKITSNGEPAIDTNNITTQAMVENGGTLILGGIYEEDNSISENKIPLLGDIPLIGYLFKTKSRSNTKSELLIFITPRIVPNTTNALRY